jgi:VWFA-related protein
MRTALTLAPQDHRIFVIMLGRGRLEDASKAITGLATFVRKLLPQDQVAVFTHDRALSFTTDHEKAAQALERFRKGHADVDLEVDAQMGPTGMAALYGTKAISGKLQTKIDEIIAGPNAARPTSSSSDVFEQDAFRTLTLDEFMFASARTLQDQANLGALLEYLRRYDGEKHLLFVTEKGVDKAALMPSDANDRSVAERANDGRVSIHTLQVGGIVTAESGKELDATHLQTLALRSLRAISELSGGVPWVVDRSGSALDRLDEVTRNGYLIGYQPGNSAWDGSYRNVAVKVNRPDVTVVYRHGYYRMPAVGGFDRRGTITNDRLIAAATFRRQVDDIKVKAKASQGQGDLLIEVSKLALTAADGKRTGTLDVGVFCLDTAGAGVGTHTTTIPISLGDEEFARCKKDGLAYSLRFPLDRGTDNIRFVVYDYRADLAGRVDTRVF